MNQVKILTACQHTGYDAEIVDFLMQIAGISAGKSYTSQIIESLQIIEVCIDMVAETVIVARVMSDQSATQILVFRFAPHHRHLTHIDDVQELFFLACRLGQTERGLHIALQAESLGYTIGRNSQSAVYLRRELPSEH